MDNLLIKERDKLDKVSRDALEQLIFKDQIIEELRCKLSKEQLENIGMKTKLKEFEDKINFMEEKLEIEENSTFTMQNKFKSSQNNNLNSFDNNFNNSNLEKINIEYQQLVEKLKIENLDLSKKYNTLSEELEIWREKSKAISEIEEIYKHQIEQLKKKADNSDILSKKLKEKENYIEEIINRYNNLQNDYEIMINNKDFENKELKSQLNILNENNEKFTNQINLLSQNSNSITQELYKEIRVLNEKNKDLELKFFKTEQKYKEEVCSLKKILEESCSNQNNNKNNINSNAKNTINDKDLLNAIKHDSTSMRMEDLATSLSKSIKEKIESQNKKITTQNIEILQLQYENEKLKSDLKYEKELNEKLQSALADLKCKNIQTQNRALFEEAQTQTILKFDDIESFKIKAKILEDNLIKTSEESEARFKKIESLKEINSRINKELKVKEKENHLLVKKIEKLNSNDRQLERELSTVNNISKLNMTVSALKMREAELLDKIQSYEERGFGAWKNNMNNNNNFNNGFQNTNISGYTNNNNDNLQNNLNLNYNYNKYKNNSKNDKNNHINNNNNNDSQNSSFNNDGFNNYNSNNNFNLLQQNQQANNNNNFNNNQFNNNQFNNNNNNLNNNNSNNNPNNNNSNNNISNINNSLVNNSLQNKDLLVEKYELELKRIQEEYFFLKDQNFHLVSEKNKLSEIQKLNLNKYSELESEKDSIIHQKNQLTDNYEKIISELKEEIEKQRNYGNNNIDEMRENLKSIQEMNTKLSDQFTSLQNKFYVQTQLIQEKNIELQSEGKIIDSLRKDNEELIQNQTKLLEKLKNAEKQNLTNINEKEKIRKELNENKEKFTDFQLKNNFSRSELEERNKILNEESKNLREVNNQLKSKIQDIQEDTKQKDNKIITCLKEEAKDLESKMRLEINDLRFENEQLLIERSSIRLQLNELKYENEFLKEQMKYKNDSPAAAYSQAKLLFDNPAIGRNKVIVTASNSSAIIQNEVKHNSNILDQNSTIDLNNQNNNNNNQNFISYLNPPLLKTNSVENEKIKSCILNQNSTHMQHIIKDNKYLEQENDFVKNENIKLHSELDILSQKFIALENTLKDSKLDFDSVLVEKDKLADFLRRKELEIKDLKLEINILQNETNNLKGKIDSYITEITIKNQTINKLLDNFENEKNQSNKKFMEMEETIIIIKNEKSKLEEKFDCIKKEFKSEKEKYRFDLTDLRKENEILLQDMEKKENEAISRINCLNKELENNIKQNSENKILLESLTSKNSELKEERIILDSQVYELSVLSMERLEKQNEKLLKSKNKLEKLVELYEMHIKFLKEKFDSNLHDFILSVNYKQGNLNEKDSEKFKLIMKNLENTSEYMNQIAGREALIVTYKDEIKNLKQNINKVTENYKFTLKEKEDLQAIVNIKKLQMKVPEITKGKNMNKDNKDKNKDDFYDNKESMCKDCAQKNLKIESLLRENTELKINEKDMDIVKNQFREEISMLEEKNIDINERNETAQKYVENIRIDLAKKEKELLDSNKLHKSEVAKIIEELKKIKEKWINPDKHFEKIEELEAKMKTLKNENSRKSDTVNLLKSQLSQMQLQTNNNNNSNLLNNTTNLNQSNLNAKVNLNNLNINNNNDSSNQMNALEEKVKNLQKEINRKDGVIKEFKTNLENLRNIEKKLSEDNATLTEKNKILKIDVNRKDEIIKDYKDKYNLLNITQKNQNTSSNFDLNNTNNKSNLGDKDSINEASNITFLQNQVKRFKGDIDRKDDIIKTLKTKLENSNNEIEQMKTLNVKNSKNNYSELEKEQKRNENLRTKIDALIIKNENLISVIRRVFKDLILIYEKNAVKNKMNNLDKSSLNYKDGMDILNIAPDELEDYLNPDEIINNNSNNKSNNLKNLKNAYDNINKMLDSDNIESDAFVDLFYSIKEKIFDMTNINNNINSSNFENNSNNVNSTYNNPFFKYNCKQINSINKTNSINNINNNQKNQKIIFDNSFQTPLTSDTEPKLKKYQNLLNKVKANDSSNFNASFENINLDGIMNDLKKIKK